MHAGTRSGEGYARLTARSVDVLAPPQEGGLLFVDMALGARDTFERVRDAWRSIPPSVVGMCSRMVLRSPVVRFDGNIADIGPTDDRRVLLRPSGDDWPNDANALADRVVEVMRENRQAPRPVHAFELPIDGPAALSDDLAPEILARCRAVELEALLRRTNAIWEPTSYHYRLPSGEHTDSFIRIADVFNDRRASAALASWLRGFTTDSTVAVVDTGTLVPLIDQLAILLERAAEQLPLSPGLAGVETMDRYPRSRFEYLRRFREISEVEILAVLSVSSSGKTYDMLAHSLSETTGGRWRAECLVSRNATDQADAVPPVDATERQNAWLAVAGGGTNGGGDCDLCRDSERARVVRIDPRTFSAMVLPEPRHEMPDIVSAARNASLFGAYDKRFAGAPAILLAPTETSRVRAQPLRRGEQRERVRFEPLTLLAQDGVADRVEKRLAELAALPQRDPARETVAAALQSVRAVRPTVVMCDHEEVKTLAEAIRLEPVKGGERRTMEEATALAEERFLQAATAVCSTIERLVVVERDLSAHDLAARLGADTSFALLVAGLQTGVTLQHLMVEIQDAAQAEPRICALVLHAHPHDSASWRSVRNTFGGGQKSALLALWLTYLPARSPFGEEHQLLMSVQDAWLDETRLGARAAWEQRMAWTRPDRPETEASPVVPSPLWSPVSMKLRRTSRYGDLDDRRVVAAMGSALSQSIDRHDRDGAPEWVQVDLPNAFRSYFDALLHVSLLRWVAPSRAWWGSPNECVSLIDELAGRFSRSVEDWRLLLAELLMAAALGKVPEEGVNVLLSYAQTMLTAQPTPHDPDADYPLAFVELGDALVRHLRLGDPTPAAGSG
ncbi:MAG: hypothetical protein JWO74_1586 [Solirubrobacterales bacterium]|nr:hypothetical protein [Solirubrobacterales bacterium]